MVVNNNQWWRIFLAQWRDIGKLEHAKATRNIRFQADGPGKIKVMEFHRTMKRLGL